MPALSVTLAIAPPSASISRTRCPVASPPIAGLHDICAIVSRFMVKRQVEKPNRAAASAASHPAWPAPTTTMSYFASVYMVNYLERLTKRKSPLTPLWQRGEFLPLEKGGKEGFLMHQNLFC